MRVPGVTVLLSGLLLGCGTFDDPSTVKDLRILAVGAEPSEVILNVATDADLTRAAIPPLFLSPLIANPIGLPVTVTISVCANDPAAASPPTMARIPRATPPGARGRRWAARCATGIRRRSCWWMARRYRWIP